MYDRGEMCNKIVESLNKDHGVNVRVTTAGRPQGNGQAESFVGSLKNKMYALMVESGTHNFPDNWDETLLHKALQILRSDPSVATGFSPMELLLGRRPVWPIELENVDIDLSGTNLTAPLVDALDHIQNNNFGRACQNIKHEQERYARSYDKRYKTNPSKLRKNNKIQVITLTNQHGLI